MARQGAIDSPPKTPFIMGSECAGDIEQVGEGVENFKVSELLRNYDTLFSKFFFNSKITFANVINSFFKCFIYSLIFQYIFLDFFFHEE